MTTIASDQGNRIKVWDNAAAQYNNAVGRMSRSGADRLVTLADELHSLDCPDNNAIDLGAGTGSLTNTLSSRFPTLPILATDISERMLEELRASTPVLSRNMVSTRVLDMADLSAYGVPEESFSHAFSTFALQAIEGQPQDAIQGIHRILRPHGTVALAIWDFDGMCGPHQIWREAAQSVDSAYVNPPILSESNWTGLRQLEAGLKRAGFREIKRESFRCHFDVGTKGFMEFFWESGNPMPKDRIRSFRGDIEKVKVAMEKLLNERYHNGRSIFVDTALALARK